MPFKVISRKGQLGSVKEKLTAAGIQVIEAAAPSEADLIKAAADVDAAIVGAVEPFTREVITSLKKCQVLSRMGIGLNNIDVEAATEQGIVVAYVPDASTEEVSDHAMAFVLCFGRKILPLSQAVRNGLWRPGNPALAALRSPMNRLSTQTLGIVGLGQIGSALCRKAKVFGMRVIIHDPYVAAGVIEKLGGEKVDFPRILAESDYVSLHLPLTKETKHLFGEAQFKKMKPTSVLINTARGGLVNEEALLNALKSGQIAGAGLDVTEPEPPNPENPLLKMENAVITAHSAYYSEQSTLELQQRTVDAVIAALNGEWPRNIANPKVKDSPKLRMKIRKAGR